MDKNKLHEIVDKLDNISDELYKGNIDIGIAEIGLVIGDMNCILAEVSEEEREVFIEEGLKPLLEAMEKRDAVYMADIIKYEFVERIRNLS